MEMPKQKKILMPRGAIQKKAEWSGTRGSYLTHIPNLSRDTLEEIEVVPIREPFTYSRIVYDLMSDLRIEDVSCDGTSIPLFIFHQKFESIKTSVIFDDEDALNSFAVMLGQRCGKQISVANPILDGTSVEGHRVQATYSKEVTTRGSSFTIRRYKEKPFTPVELVKFGTASAEMVAYLWIAVENGKSMMVCGGTAGGETATPNSAALFIRPGAEILSLGDTPRILLTALNFVIIQSHARIGDSIVRRMKQIVELVGFEPETNELITNTVYEWDAATDTFVYKGHSFLFDEIMEMKNMTHEEMEAEFQRRVDIVNYMLQKNMIDFREIAKIVVQYYQYPEDTAKRVREEMGWQDHAVMKAVDTGGETVG